MVNVSVRRCHHLSFPLFLLCGTGGVYLCYPVQNIIPVPYSAALELLSWDQPRSTNQRKEAFEVEPDLGTIRTRTPRMEFPSDPYAALDRVLSFSSPDSRGELRRLQG
ncbi:hypothetical protein BX600DRAFT_246426 [Xylariales sp. PMI_506]|nr:hypothetical protein BX600DRAFT_246426 [Xylariales sp. PMI_506]